MRFWLYPAFVILLCFTACNIDKFMQTRHQTATDYFLDTLLQRHTGRLGVIFRHPDSYRLQIIYTKIDRDAHNRPHFTHYTYRVQPDRYFYPASTVKLPGALLALEKLNDLAIPGLDRNTPMFSDSLPGISSGVLRDSSASNRMPSVANYIKKIFLVSDNDAFNRLYELIGQEDFNHLLWNKGYQDVQIRHRVGIPLNVADNLQTNGIRFMEGRRELYYQPSRDSRLIFSPRHDSIGKAHYNYLGKLINSPMDFSYRNRLPLRDLHDMLQQTIFPECVTKSRRFRLTEDDYLFLYRCMSQYPSEAALYGYDSSRFNQAYVKFLLFGGDKQARIPSYIRIFNKPGWAYGFLTDAAYVVDFKHQVEFLLSATVYVNNDDVLGDDRYEFEETGKPFLKALGEIIYEYELQRERSHQPDLSRYHIDYDQNDHY